MMKQILVLFVLMVMVPMTTVIAAPDTAADSRNTIREPENYVTIKIGAFMPKDDALDDGVAISAGLGHMINKNFAVEAEFDYYFTDFNDDDNHYFGNPDVYIIGIPVTAKFILPVSHEVNLFAGAGLGIYFTGVVFDHDEYYDDDDYYHDDDDDSINDTSLGFHCLIGADIKIKPTMAITMDVKYTEVQNDFDDSYFGQDYNFEVGGTTVFLGAKILF